MISRKNSNYLIDNAQLMSEWNYEKNKDIDPNKLTCGTNKKAWWVGKCSHEWQASISDRCVGTGCPYCSNKIVLIGYNDLYTTNPNLASEWHPTKNISLKPTDVVHGSNKSVWWLCSKGHEWQAAVKSRVGGRGCPICSNSIILTGYNDLATTNPNLASEWHLTKNGSLKPTDVSSGTNKKVFWFGKCGHEWQATIQSRNNGSTCPICINQKVLKGYNDLASTNPDLALEWHPIKNGNLKPTDVVSGSGKRAWWTCPKGHVYEAPICRRSNGCNCPICKNEAQTSFPEQSILYYLSKLTTTISRYKVIGKMEIDIFLPDFNIGIEYDGIYYHSTRKSDETERRKNYEIKNKGIYLIRVKETSDNNYNFDNDDSIIYCKPNSNHYYLKSVIAQIINIINIKLGTKYIMDISIDRDRIEILNQYLSNIKLNSISVCYPDLLFQWHPIKNGDLKPEYFSIGSNYKVWWQCELGHEWQATIVGRISGKGCPYCCNSIVLSGYNDLVTMNSDLASEWHPTKNSSLKPSAIISGSGKKAWWLGKCGHEWQATVINRNRGYGCPYCCNRLTLQGYNDLATTNPKIASEWHPTKNGSLKPTDVSSGSNKKVWWFGKCGHEWQASVNNRNNGTTCTVCLNQKTLLGYNDLATINPKLALEWHPTKNDSLKPVDVVSGSSRRIWWLCSKGHEWQATVYDRTNGSSCPYCKNKKVLKGYNDLATTNPKLALEWHPEKNGSLKPSDVGTGSNKRIWWLCSKGHEWQTKVNDRKGSGCPYCSNNSILPGYNDLATTNPDLASEWHPIKNGSLKTSNIISGSSKKVWWLGKCGHEWQATVYSRKTGSECPYCSNKIVMSGHNDLATTNPKLASEWHPEKNEDIKPTDFMSGSKIGVWWLCSKGHEWKASISDRNNGTGCPYCSNKMVLPGYNDLATTNPDIALEWHTQKNVDLKASDITAGSGKKIWWVCSKCGHEWQAVLINRKNGSGCPICANKRKGKGR